LHGRRLLVAHLLGRAVAVALLLGRVLALRRAVSDVVSEGQLVRLTWKRVCCRGGF
jgi:hypothetical protein